MEISSAQSDSTAAVAVTKQMLNQMQVQGASLINMIVSAPVSPGSVNSASQGLRLDVRV